MTKALDAASDAVLQAFLADCGSKAIARAALRAALPAEPDAEMIEAMQFAFGIALDQPWRAANAYRVVRARLLGEDA